MRRATLEEREHLCRLDKAKGGDELLGFLEWLGFWPRRKRMTQVAALSALFNSPDKTDLSEDRIKDGANRLRDLTGIEMTPEEYQDTIETIFFKVRREMVEKGLEVPESDRVLSEMLEAARNG